jgi:hypothetical protein
MRKQYSKFELIIGLVICVSALTLIVPRSTLAGIIQAIIPAAAPTANKQGNGSKFQIATGAAGSAGNCIEYDGNGNAVDSGAACAGSVGQAGATLFSSTSSATATAASATSLIGSVTGSTTVPVNTFVAGGVLEILGQGFYTSTGLRTLTIDLFIGGSARISTGAVTMPSATLGTWQLRCGVTTRTAGVSGTQIANCVFLPTGTSALGTGFPMQTSATWTVDTTATLAVDLKATWDSTTGAPTITGSNIAAWIPGAPVTSVGGQVGAVQGEGNGSKVQMFTGSDPATNDCAKFDANHNIVSAGGTCATGIAGITQSTTITPNALSSAPASAVPLTGWTLKNVANAKQSFNDFNPLEVVMSSGNFATLQWAGVTRTISVPYTLIALVQLRGGLGNSVVTTTQVGGICVSDGTKYENIELLFDPNTANVGLEMRTLTSLSVSGTVFTGPTTDIVGLSLAVKIVNNSTNRIWSYWSNGAWVQFLSEASGTFLTETAAGGCTLNDNSTGGYTLDLAIKYFSVV